MDSTQLLKGVLDLAVLAVLRDEDGYGYDIVRRLRPAGLDEVGDASVYGTLRRLFQAGSLTTYVVPSEEGPHRKYYALNKAGHGPVGAVAQGVGRVRPTRWTYCWTERWRPDGHTDAPTTVEIEQYYERVRAALGRPGARGPRGTARGPARPPGRGARLEGAARVTASLQTGSAQPEAYADELRAAAGLEPR